MVDDGYLIHWKKSKERNIDISIVLCGSVSVIIIDVINTEDQLL